MAASPQALAGLRALGDRARPLTLAGERTLPVLAPLAPLVPGGALKRGSSVAVAGPGATALGLTLVAAASTEGAWTAVVGAPDLGLAAAAELGIDLDRLVVVAWPPPERWGTVVAALAEAVTCLVVRPPPRIRPAESRRLAAHLRERGGVLVRLPGPGSRSDGAWPEAADLTLRTARSTWTGTVAPDRADGAGRLRARRITVVAEGRRSASRPTRTDLWLPGADGRVAAVVPAAVVPAAVVPGPVPRSDRQIGTRGRSGRSEPGAA